jgi:hypothetical protein
MGYNISLVYLLTVAEKTESIKQTSYVNVLKFVKERISENSGGLHILSTGLKQIIADNLA